jgi:hypothetical protein
MHGMTIGYKGRVHMKYKSCLPRCWCDPPFFRGGSTNTKANQDTMCKCDINTQTTWLEVEVVVTLHRGCHTGYELIHRQH